MKTSISEFLDSLFEEEFGDQARYDPQVVELVKEHLEQNSLGPKAASRLAEALVQLAKAHAVEGDQ
jgi:Ran GTPase-activating protein (RanGAP) involved in mRNA processing and transport